MQAVRTSGEGDTLTFRLEDGREVRHRPDSAQISVKAAWPERVGGFGRGEKIPASAVAPLEHGP